MCSATSTTDLVVANNILFIYINRMICNEELYLHIIISKEMHTLILYNINGDNFNVHKVL